MYDPGLTPNSVLDRDFAKFKADGLDHVTICIYWYRVETALGVYDDNFLANIVRVIQRAKLAGLNVMLSHHMLWGSDSTWCCPSYAIDPVTGIVEGLAIIRDPNIYTAWLAMTTHMMNYLAGQPIEAWLLNEPWYWPHTLPAPYNTVNQKENFITLFQTLNSLALSKCGCHCYPKFVCSTDVKNIFTDDWGNDPRIFALGDTVCFNAYDPFISPMSGYDDTNFKYAASLGKKIWITEFGSSSDTDSVQSGDIEASVDFFKRYPAITLLCPWMWHDDTADNPGMGGFDLAANVNGNVRPAYNILIKEANMATITYLPSSAHTGTVPLTVTPSGLACTAELFVGPDASHKAATSGPIAFTATAAQQNVVCPINMPTAGGSYTDFLNVVSGGVLIGAFAGGNIIQVPTVVVGTVTWS